MAYLGNSPLNALFSFAPVALAQGQTNVLVNYTPGRCLFFKNGALLEPNVDYTATNGSTVTLASPASAGDVLFGINLASFAVANALPLTGGVLSGPLTGPESATDTQAGLISRASIPTTQYAKFTTSTQSAAANTATKLVLSATAFNTIPGLAYSSGNLTLPAGTYRITAQVMAFTQSGQGAAGDGLSLDMRKDGNSIAIHRANYYASGTGTGFCSKVDDIVECDGTNVLTLYWQSVIATNLVAGAYYNYIAINRLK